MNKLPPDAIESLKAFLREDIRSGDITTNAMKPLNAEATATIYSKGKSILAGIVEAVAIAEFSGLKYEILLYEGNWVDKREPVMRISGSAKTILSVERVCLNIIMRMSGIATMTYNMLKSARNVNPKVRVAATRKTTPGFRFFEKRAVKVGGGDTHRYALDDMVLIKNNHIDVVGGVSEAIRMAREAVSFSKKISCEARTIQEGLDAAKAGADIILLDNFKPEDIRRFDTMLKEQGLRDRILLETSGGIDESNIEQYAATGIDIISSGALTHSYISADFNMITKLN
ncbi:MAG: carboxylating nicotinate-nucleotide diphosphorylase [Candidatus Thorarchaeota archaeon]|nr:carboxylating nicotinate-nucleotide diphosphorylase [Candidatus Thorarchaeota archaeon]